MNPGPNVATRRESSGALGELLFGLALWVGTAVIASAALAPPLHGLLDSAFPGEVPFVRLLRRVAQLVALVGLVVWMRRRGVRDLRAIGLGWTPEARRALVAGLAWGAAAIVPAFAYELVAGNRAPSPGELSAARAGEALAGAAAIGVLEEGVCRGALLIPFTPLPGGAFWVANAAVSSLYSVAHFARGGERSIEVDAGSGFRVWGALPRAVVDHAEAAVGLWLTGALLYLVAARQGHVWGAVGVHAGAVAALQLLGTATEPVAGRDALFLVDGLLPGWGLSALLAAAIVALALRAPSPGPARHA